MWERGLKQHHAPGIRRAGGSLPMWERGLKLMGNLEQESRDWSLPMWERGLKHDTIRVDNLTQSRSPCGSVD